MQLKVGSDLIVLDPPEIETPTPEPESASKGQGNGHSGVVATASRVRVGGTSAVAGSILVSVEGCSNAAGASGSGMGTIEPASPRLRVAGRNALLASDQGYCQGMLIGSAEQNPGPCKCKLRLKAPDQGASASNPVVAERIPQQLRAASHRQQSAQTDWQLTVTDAKVKPIPNLKVEVVFANATKTIHTNRLGTIKVDTTRGAPLLYRLYEDERPFKFFPVNRPANPHFTKSFNPASFMRDVYGVERLPDGSIRQISQPAGGGAVMPASLIEIMRDRRTLGRDLTNSLQVYGRESTDGAGHVLSYAWNPTSSMVADLYLSTAPYANGFASRHPYLSRTWENTWKGGFANAPPTEISLVVNVIIGFVPVVGQIADVRDLAAAIIALCRPTPMGESVVGQWIELAFCVVALLPGVGDAVKSLWKAAKSGLVRTPKAFGRISEALEALAHDANYGRIVAQYLRSLGFGSPRTFLEADYWKEIFVQARRFAAELIARIRSVLDWIRRDWPRALHKRLADFRDLLNTWFDLLDRGFAAVSKLLRTTTKPLDIRKLENQKRLQRMVRKAGEELEDVLDHAIEAVASEEEILAVLRTAKRQVGSATSKTKKYAVDWFGEELESMSRWTKDFRQELFDTFPGEVPAVLKALIDYFNKALPNRDTTVEEVTPSSSAMVVPLRSLRFLPPPPVALERPRFNLDPALLP